MILWKKVTCRFGNVHDVFCVQDLINLPYDCNGICLEREETSEQIETDFQKSDQEEICSSQKESNRTAEEGAHSEDVERDER